MYCLLVSCCIAHPHSIVTPLAYAGTWRKAGIRCRRAGLPSEACQLGSEGFTSLHGISHRQLGCNADVLCQYAAHICAAIAAHQQPDCSVHLPNRKLSKTSLPMTPHTAIPKQGSVTSRPWQTHWSRAGSPQVPKQRSQHLAAANQKYGEADKAKQSQQSSCRI